MTAAETGRVPVPPTVSAPLLVVATFYCEPRGAAPHYEVHLAPREIDSPRGLIVAHSHLCSCLVLVTRDERIYADALDAEGTPARIVARYHRAGGKYGVIDALDIQP